MMNLEQMATDVAVLLKARGETVAVSESSTGGLVSAALLAVPGASAYFVGGGVVYTGVSRRVILELDEVLPAETRSSSEPYAKMAAVAIRERMNTTWGLAETGAAGPRGNRYGDASGHSCLAIVGPASKVITVETGEDDREANMWRFTQAALDLFAEVLRAQ
ncbi:MAG: CinA family protein [Chromatiales bacterium]|nr:CinA family protein [Chromatiales bacterium]